jgi:hypothetical protein
MIEAMSEKRQPGVIGSLPSTRPHRRSGKRATPGSPVDAAASASVRPVAKADPVAKPRAAAEPTPPVKAAAKPVRAKPAAARTQAANRSRRRVAPPAHGAAAPAPASPGALQTAVEAAAELTEIGLRASARAFRVALSRLPKP